MNHLQAIQRVLRAGDALSERLLAYLQRHMDALEAGHSEAEISVSAMYNEHPQRLWEDATCALLASDREDLRALLQAGDALARRYDLWRRLQEYHRATQEDVALIPAGELWEHDDAAAAQLWELTRAITLGQVPLFSEVG